MSLSFQELILRLQQFWSTKGGCILWQPYSEKVGAGTMNPATVLQVIGPEPWNVAYVEPSYRPDDGRFGKNPNRMQMHTQYQVILKPDPGNPQELYLESLRACGIDTDSHDIRFVEDNWESPALGAWGLGWEVWLDGLEITQFTYFQQSAGQVLETPAIEITYGLERIAMFIQGVRSVWNLDWNGHYTYGDVLLQPEIDHCRYDFEVADVNRLKELYRLYEAEAKNALASGLVVPAHDYVLRCSHTFNVLDAQGAIGVTERAAYFGKMRDMARQTAENYLAQRESLGFPLLHKANAHVPTKPVATENHGTPPTQASTFVLEVGTEELPSHEVSIASHQLKNSLIDLLTRHRLDHGSLEVYATPRRLTVVVNDLAAQQADREIEVKGPPANVALDGAGQPTKAGLGFCKAQGIDPKTLRIESDGKRTFVATTKRELGRQACDVLGSELPGIISGLRFGRTMRWNESRVSFSRPVRWIVALHETAVISFSYAGFLSGRTSRGLRPLGSPPIELLSADAYLSTMASHQISVDRAQRQQDILKQIHQAANSVGGRLPTGQEALLEEVTDLVECPFALVGEFDEEHLKLPACVLVTVMKKHQRYFPVEKADGTGLLPYFVVVCNGEPRQPKLVAQGYEDVLRARYADAAYFVLADRKKALASYAESLASLTFETELGSMLDKQARLQKLVSNLADELQVGLAERQTALRAAALAKNDLATSMVVEMTSLQGILGEVYALDSGEDPKVAQAIREQYLPKAAGGAHPQALPGVLLGLADRLDSLVGLFAVGKKPTGSADPFALRRHALTLIDLLVSRKLSISLDTLFTHAANHLPVQISPEGLKDLLAFTQERMLIWFKDQGHRHDLVEAAVFGGSADPYRIAQALESLSHEVLQDSWDGLFNAYARCCRITKGYQPQSLIDPAHLIEPQGRALYDRYQEVSSDLPFAEVPALIEALSVLQPAIDEFFDKVLVMVEDEQLKVARLSLLAKIAHLPQGLIDLSKVEGF